MHETSDACERVIAGAKSLGGGEVWNPMHSRGLTPV